MALSSSECRRVTARAIGVEGVVALNSPDLVRATQIVFRLQDIFVVEYARVQAKLKEPDIARARLIRAYRSAFEEALSWERERDSGIVAASTVRCLERVGREYNLLP